MSLYNKARSWILDRKRVSMEGHEIDYVKDLARKHLKLTEGVPDHNNRIIRTGSLRKLCKYVLKAQVKR